MLEQEPQQSPELAPLIINLVEMPSDAVPAPLKTPTLKKILGTELDETDERVRSFIEQLCRELEPDQSTEEVAAKVVTTALEVEFGPAGIRDLKLEKFVKLMTEAICLNPEMKKRTIALASRCLRVKLDISGQPPQ